MDFRTDRTKPVLFAVLLLSLLGTVVVGGDLVGLFRAVLGFVVLTVVPGYLCLMLLEMGDLSPGRVAVYAVGLSLVLVVFVAIALNGLLSLFGFDRPLTPLRLTVAVLVLIFGLGGVRYWTLAESSLRGISLSGRDRIAVVVVSLLPVASVCFTVFGGRVFEWLLLFLLCALSVVPLVLVWWQGTRALVPYAIWAVSVSVLLQMTLVSGHLWGFDIHFEYFTAANILHSGYWDPTLGDPSNSLVTVTLLGAVYSMVTGIELVWVYKLIYPLLVSLFPLCIWYITKSAFADRSLATLAPFALVFYYGFFKDMPDKQLVAGLFAVLLLVVFLDEALSRTQRWVLGGAFAVGLTFSHYGVSLLFAAFFGGGLIARYGLQRATPIDSTARITRPALVGFLGGFWVVWYLFSASGVNFYRVVGVGFHLLETLPFPTTGRSGAAYATTGFDSVYWIIYKFLYIGLVGLIGLGILSALYSIYTDREDACFVEYSLFSGGVFAFLVASVVFSFGLGFDRTLQIALFVVGPFAVVGARTGVAVVSWGGSRLWQRLPQGNRFSTLRARVGGRSVSVTPETLFAVFLAVLFLFSSGTAFAVGGAQVPPYNINIDEDAGWPVYSQSEVEATRWLGAHTDGNDTVAVYNEWEHIKSRDGLLVSEVVPADQLEPIWLERRSLDRSAYVYVSHKPMRKLDSDSAYIDVRETPFYSETLATAEVVYETENATIYYVRTSS